ncbi:DUF493 family protein [Carboxylicivirga linearis]|uniref:DUF493 family protein n=1 Tax=Carboxylicivirga linearis TaxID=1628157 RepID=A0ABS5JWY6_9BACT|nr:DUF493 family protein [Carboxylicivirga linearis]MBS2099437.1 DUF493 family protein [Carboxylicivirga linearis]
MSSTMQNYEKLKALLLENKKWPMVYMFKFIVPNKDGMVDNVKDKLPKHGTFSYNHTKSLSHVAITCKASMKSADSIIKVTEEIASIEGVISL